jgi:hypothetical protein
MQWTQLTVPYMFMINCLYICSHANICVYDKLFVICSHANIFYCDNIYSVKQVLMD